MKKSLGWLPAGMILIFALKTEMHELGNRSSVNDLKQAKVYSQKYQVELESDGITPKIILCRAFIADEEEYEDNAMVNSFHVDASGTYFGSDLNLNDVLFFVVFIIALVYLLHDNTAESG